MDYNFALHGNKIKIRYFGKRCNQKLFNKIIVLDIKICI